MIFDMEDIPSIETSEDYSTFSFFDEQNKTKDVPSVDGIFEMDDFPKAMNDFPETTSDDNDDNDDLTIPLDEQFEKLKITESDKPISEIKTKPTTYLSFLYVPEIKIEPAIFLNFLRAFLNLAEDSSIETIEKKLIEKEFSTLIEICDFSFTWNDKKLLTDFRKLLRKLKNLQ